MSDNIIVGAKKTAVVVGAQRTILIFPRSLPGNGNPTTWLNALPEYETDDDANNDLNVNDFYWLAPPSDVGQNRTLKQKV